MPMDCIFCKIIKKEIRAKILADTEHTTAFLDAFPLTKGHTLVIPKKHYEKVQDIPSEENIDLFETVRKLLKNVDVITGATLVAIHNGKESGQEIPHVHVHLVPRSLSDGAGPIHKMFTNSPKLTEDENSSLQKKLRIS